ncbi:MAG: hypothetical protein U0263_21965 [Polyangiaceae bacterium]
MTTTRADKDGSTHRALWAVVLVGALATGGAFVMGGAPVARSVAVGAVVALGNLFAIGLVVRGILNGKKSRVPWPLVAVLKMTLLFGGLYLLLKSGFVSLLPLLVGYGALPIGIVAAQLGAPQPVEEEG